MQSITFKIENNKDYYLLISLAERLGIPIFNSEVNSEKNKIKKKWKFIGSVKLDKSIDDINLRDFAYE